VILNEPGFSYFFAGFRMMEPPFTDERFRKAVYLATDFDAAVAAIFPPELAVRAYGTVPPGLWPRDEEYLKGVALKQDQEQAKALFQELIDEGVMPEDYTITVAPPPDDARISIAEVMVTNLQEVGVNAEIVKVDWGTYTDMLTGDENMIYMLGTIPAIPDPDANIRWLFSEGSSHGRYLNLPAFEEYPEWDAQIKQAQQSQDRAEREQIYRDLVRTMMEGVIHIPLYHKNAIMAKRDYVKEFEVDKRFRWNIVRPWANVYIEGKE
jgi:peptide/nickel transport system substrate-binding protein